MKPMNTVLPSALEAIGSDFEDRVYPLVTAAFGREWSPGVDSDPRIAILHANLMSIFAMGQLKCSLYFIQ